MIYNVNPILPIKKRLRVDIFFSSRLKVRWIQVSDYINKRKQASPSFTKASIIISKAGSVLMIFPVDWHCSSRMYSSLAIIKESKTSFLFWISWPMARLTVRRKSIKGINFGEKRDTFLVLSMNDDSTLSQAPYTTPNLR